MAVKWAVANGNWSAGSTWNDGSIPQSGDDVYLDNHIVILNVDVNIGNGTIRNDINPNTNYQGGYLSITANRRNVVANLINVATYIILYGSNAESDYNFVGNITSSGTYVFYNNGSATYGRRTNITGNVSANDIFRETSMYNEVTIIGNVNCTLIENRTTANARLLVHSITGDLTIVAGVCNQNWSKLVINGNFTILSTNTTTGPLNLTGVLFSKNNSYPYFTSVTINGAIKYEDNQRRMGLRYNSLTVQNPDTFTWKDVTEPRSNPFIIVTDAEMNNHQQYPAENEVKEGTEYVWGEKVGTYQQPPESVVLKDYVYDNDERVGTLDNETLVGCVTKEDVREGVPLIGMYEDGQQVVGTIVIPAEEDVREGVHYDNNKVGTLIVQGGGDRLRIADFGYYTNAQSDTYIVDLTEQDKPKFAVAEERVLIEMFPELDLDNIPDKYFDDLFVKYLKYRLIVEYYRTAGINSTFTPSEPTTEIVNYQNVRNEVWLNSANIYLKAWAKKYPESIVKPQRILL